MAWVTFTSRAAFDVYSLAACAAHSIPRPGWRSDNNTTVMLNNQWTFAWVGIFGAFLDGGNAILLCQVPDVDVATYGLTPANTPTLPPTGPNTILFNGTTHTIFSVAEDWLQPKPATWTDPHDGHIYTVT